METLTIIRPDDWHLHLRDGAAMQSVVAHSARQFARAIIMPNLNPPVTTVAEAEAYHARILAALEPQQKFDPLMTLYLTDNTSPLEILRAAASPRVHAVKLYPAGATTNSDRGVTDLHNSRETLEAMQQQGLPLLVHGEATGESVDVFDREKVFIERTLQPLMRDFPELRIVFEHITTAEAVDFVLSEDPARLAATITPHHLLINRNALFRGGLRPHHYCLPVAKREEHRQALLAAATRKPGRFFAGTDSAPHPRHAKESACGCAGIYSALSAVELYATAFEQAGDFSHFETFMSSAGAAFYRLPINTETITLERREWTLPERLPFADGEELIPFLAGQSLSWKLKTEKDA
jgi:dihydroorotase